MKLTKGIVRVTKVCPVCGIAFQVAVPARQRRMWASHQLEMTCTVCDPVSPTETGPAVDDIILEGE